MCFILVVFFNYSFWLAIARIRVRYAHILAHYRSHSGSLRSHSGSLRSPFIYSGSLARTFGQAVACILLADARIVRETVSCCVSGTLGRKINLGEVIFQQPQIRPRKADAIWGGRWTVRPPAARAADTEAKHM